MSLEAFLSNFENSLSRKTPLSQKTPLIHRTDAVYEMANGKCVRCEQSIDERIVCQRCCWVCCSNCIVNRVCKLCDSGHFTKSCRK